MAYVARDLREVGTLADSFDAVINMWQSLSYFVDDTNVVVLRAIHDRLATGGRFVLDQYNRAYFERQPGTKQQVIKDIIVESRGYMQGDRWHSELTYREANGAITGGDHMEWRLYTPEEFQRLAAACGFATRLACAWWDESLAPSPDIGRMQIVLECR